MLSQTFKTNTYANTRNPWWPVAEQTRSLIGGPGKALVSRGGVLQARRSTVGSAILFIVGKSTSTLRREYYTNITII